MSLGSPILAKLRPYARTSKVWEHPPAELKSEKQEAEPHEVKPQDAIPIKFSLDQRRALDSELSLSQSSFKFSEDKTDKYAPLNPRSSTSSSIIHLIQRQNVGLIEETVRRLRLISYLIFRHIGNRPVKAKARIVFLTCLCLKNFNAQEETNHR